MTAPPLADRAAAPDLVGKAPRHARTGWPLVLLLAVVNLSAFSDRFLLAVVATPVKQALALSDAQIGLLQGTAFAVLHALAMPGLGILADRGYQRALLLGSLAVWGLATLLAGFAESFAILFLSRLALGLGQAGVVPSALSLLAHRGERGRTALSVAFLTAGGSLGRSLAFLGGGAALAWLAARDGIRIPDAISLAPWRALLVYAALPNVVLALLIVAIVTPRPAPAIPRGARFVLAWVVRRRRTYLPHFAASAAAVLMGQTLIAWAPTFYTRSHGMGAAESGMRLGLLVLLAAPIGHFSAGLFLDRRKGGGGAGGRRSAAPWMLGAALLLAVPVTAVMGLAADRTVSLAGFATLVAILGWTSPAALAGLQFLTPVALRGRVSALFVAAITLIAVGTGPLLLGLLSDVVFGAGGLGGAFLTLFSVMGCLGAVAAYAAARSIRPRNPGRAPA